MQTVANHAPLDRNDHCHCQSDFRSPLYRRLAVDSFSISVTQQPYVFLPIQSVTSPWPLNLYREDIAQPNQLYRQLSTRGRNSTTSQVEITLEYGYIASHQVETASGEIF